MQKRTVGFKPSQGRAQARQHVAFCMFCTAMFPIVDGPRPAGKG